MLGSQLYHSLQMRYVAAYLLANLGGNDSPSAKDIKKILESVGVNVDDEKLNKVVSELDGKDINEVFIFIFFICERAES